MNSLSTLDRRTCFGIWLTFSLMHSEVTDAQQIIPFSLVQIITSDSADDASIDSTTEDEATPHVFIFGSTQLSSSEEAFNTMSASGKFQAMVLPNDKFGFTIAYNTFGINPNTVAKDSLDVPTLVFPDAGNTGFMVSAFYTTTISKNITVASTQSVTRLTHYIEFSLRNTKIRTVQVVDHTASMSTDSSEEEYDEYDEESYEDADAATTTKVLNFTTRNVNVGTRLDWLYVPKSDATQVVQTGVSVYLNYFSVPKEHAKAFLQTTDKNIRRINFYKHQFAWFQNIVLL